MRSLSDRGDPSILTSQNTVERVKALQRCCFKNHAASARFGNATKEDVGVSAEMSRRLVAVESPLQESMQGDKVEMGLQWIVMQIHLLLHGAL